MTVQEEMLYRYGNWSEAEYLDLMDYIITSGEDRKDRTGIGTKSIFFSHMSIDLGPYIPILTTKKMAWKSIVSELLWFIEGSTNERRLAEIHYGKPRSELVGKRTIWTDNADNQGVMLGHYNSDINKNLGPVYGKQWRDWDGVDQLATLIQNLKDNPYSRRHILSAWNVGELDQMSLPPCHMFSQFNVSNNGELSCILYQRSCDMFLGVPFNIASYALLTHILAKMTRLTPKSLYWVGGDCHVYKNHMDVVEEQLKRTPYMYPKIWINPNKTIENYTVDDFELYDYKTYDKLNAPMAI